MLSNIFYVHPYLGKIINHHLVYKMFNFAYTFELRSFH